MRFRHGDHVRIAADLGPSMRHFPGAGGEAIVIGSYGDQYGGGDHDSLTLHVRGHGENSWYGAKHLTLIASGQHNLLAQWEAEAEAKRAQESDLDWVFAHGEEVLCSASGATVAALARCFGLTDLWGPRGEGVTYWTRAARTLQFAEPFLRTGDKAGWLAWCRVAVG